MLFSRQAVETAYNYIGVYYDKILQVDLEHDLFFPIKVNDTESIPMGKSFTEWVKSFIHSSSFKPYGENRTMDEFTKYYDLEYLKKLRMPLIVRYQKLIGTEYHNVELIFMPIGPISAYLFVRDETKMMTMQTYSGLD